MGASTCSKVHFFQYYTEWFEVMNCGENQFNNSNEKSEKEFSAVAIDCCCFMFILITITNITDNDCGHFCGSYCGRITGLAKAPVLSKRLARLVAVLISMLIVFMGYYTFKTTWTPSSKVAALANTLQLTTPILLLIVGVVDYIACSWMVKVWHRWKENAPY